MIKRFLTFSVSYALFLLCCNAQDVKQLEVEKVISVQTEYSDGSVLSRILADDEYVDEQGIVRSTAKEDENSKLVGIAARYSHFIWGVETGVSCDLSGLGMSTYNLDVLCGYRNRWIQAVGIGAGMHKALGNRDTFLPVYAVIHTSFNPRPSLLFFHLRIGYNFNTIADSPVFGDTAAGIGLGCNLFQKRKFQSYILLAYTFRHYNTRHTEMTNLSRSDVSLAQIGFGLTF